MSGVLRGAEEHGVLNLIDVVRAVVDRWTGDDGRLQELSFVGGDDFDEPTEVFVFEGGNLWGEFRPVLQLSFRAFR